MIKPHGNIIDYVSTYGMIKNTIQTNDIILLSDAYFLSYTEIRNRRV